MSSAVAARWRQIDSSARNHRPVPVHRMHRRGCQFRCYFLRRLHPSLAHTLTLAGTVRESTSRLRSIESIMDSCLSAAHCALLSLAFPVLLSLSRTHTISYSCCVRAVIDILIAVFASTVWLCVAAAAPALAAIFESSGIGVFANCRSFLSKYIIQYTHTVDECLCLCLSV